MVITDQVARTICRESCAVFGDKPCFELHDPGKATPWPNPHCNKPVCRALTKAVNGVTPVGAFFHSDLLVYRKPRNIGF